MKKLFGLVVFLALLGGGVYCMIRFQPEHPVTKSMLRVYDRYRGRLPAVLRFDDSAPTGAVTRTEAPVSESTPAAPAPDKSAKPAAPAPEKPADAQPVEPAAAPLPEGWYGFEDANWLSGKKITDAVFKKRVALVYVWAEDDAESVELLSRVQDIWSSFKSKPFVTVGVHRGASAERAKKILSKRRVTFPVYSAAGHGRVRLPETGPYLAVVDHRGRIVYRGRSDRSATEAVVTAVTSAALAK